MNAFSLIEHLSKLPDYRQPWKTDYKLTDILRLITCAMITGAKQGKRMNTI
ncbi:transposase family protein [Sansalvadorimonas verongulae]|uniref:transposase family protein n=1 Tax=Sansalvadorimonas verongulae TaxID=2172824 RepID=UPI0012BC948B|nr:transposase family protein [Sansalvadorimonas verongulae]